MFEPKQINELNAPLSREHVRQRSQAGRQLSYIEGWHAIAEANRIFGHSEWDRELTCIKQLGDAREIDGKWRVAYMATVRVRVRAGEIDDVVTRDGTGYGSGIDRDLGSAHESALKEAETDAMKRALMTFGNPFGLALYDKEQREVCDAPKDAKPPKQDNAAPRQPLGLTPPKNAPESEMACFDAVVKAIANHKTYGEFKDWWVGYQPTAKEVFAKDYYEATLSPAIIGRLTALKEAA